MEDSADHYAKPIYSTSVFTNEFGWSPLQYGNHLEQIKVCNIPECMSIYHNCPTSVKHCEFCGGNIKIINEQTYWKKFSNEWFQYHQPTGEYFRPKKHTSQINIQFD